MKKVILMFLLSGLALLSSCKKNDDSSPEINAYVTGVILVNNQPLVNSLITLDNDRTKNTTTDQFGKFQIFGLQNGEHTLAINGALDNGGTIYSTVKFSLQNQNVELGILSFPKPPEILVVDTLTNTKAVTIKWDRLREADFKGYAVYRSNTADVYDSTAELVFSSASVTDTSYTDNSYTKGVSKSYRVYSYTKGGRVYASNVDGVNVPPKNYITNGSFENSFFGGIMPSSWTYNNQGISSYQYMNMTAKTAKEGKWSLEVSWTDSIAKFSHQGTLYQRLDVNKLTPGKTYRWSFWVKSEVGKLGAYLVIADKFKYMEIPGGQDWTQLSHDFVFTKDISLLRVEIISSRDSGSRLHGWIDDMKLNEVINK